MLPPTISRYRILSRLGAGGMGDVYLAEDPTLERRVAIKVLSAPSASDETARLRLVREAQAAAKIDHPNVCAIYEVGADDSRDFFVMQYVEGLTLAQRIAQGPFTIDELLAIAEQAADALSAAHGQNLIHRDIKPQNLMLDARGQVKVMDFGLAKTVAEPSGRNAEVNTVAELTAAGAIPGTTAYMSPEQLRGEALDAQSDLFSLGCVLQEMATRRHPFKRDSVAGTIAAVLDDTPADIVVSGGSSTGLQRIVRKCLEKDRNRRYQTATDLLVDLRNLRSDPASASGTSSVVAPARRLWVPAVALLVAAIVAFAGWRAWWDRQPSGPLSIHVLAILPFATSEPGTEYLGEGISDTLINSLSQLPQLKVMARTTTFRYRGETADARAIRRDLGVDAIVSGRVIQQGGALVVQADLTNAVDGTTIWGERYSRQLVDVFAVQEEIAREIATKLQLHLTGREAAGLTKRYTSNVEAYRNYMLGRQLAQPRTPAGLQSAVGYYEQAIALDSRYALAFAGLTDAYTNLTNRGVVPLKEGREKARAAARMAVELDPDLAEAHAAVGQTHVYVAPFDFVNGERELRKAIELSPSWAIGYQYLGVSLTAQGRLDEGLEAWETARDLDPHSGFVAHLIAGSYYLKRDFARALELQRAANRLGPAFSTFHEVELYLQADAEGEALADIDRLTPGRESDPYLVQARGMLLAHQKRRNEALAVAERLDRMSADQPVLAPLSARIYLSLGDADAAFARMDQALDAGAVGVFYRDSAVWDPVRSDPRFTKMLQRMNVPVTVRPGTN